MSRLCPGRNFARGRVGAARADFVLNWWGAISERADENVATILLACMARLTEARLQP